MSGIARTAARLGLHPSPVRRAFDAVAGSLPTGRTLPANVFLARHRAMLVLLWLHVPALFALAVLRGNTVRHSAVEVAVIAALALAATLDRFTHRARASIASLGLITCSAVLVHFSGGYIEAHFHFFVMIGLLSLYEDWVPFLVAAGYVVLHHGVGGALDPKAVYNHPAAIEHPWTWALIHALFVTGAGIASVVAWRLNEVTRGELRDANVHLAHAQEVSGTGSWVRDIRTGEVTWSAELYRLLGAELGTEVDPDSFLGLLHPEDLTRVSALLDETATNGARLDYEARVIVGGEERRVHARGEAEMGRQGPMRIFGTLEDVTERRRAEHELYELKERFRHAFEEAPIGVALVAVHGTGFGGVLQVNRAVCKITGYSREQLLETNFTAITHPDDRALSESAAQSYLTGEATSYDVEKRYVHADGHPVWVQIRASLVRDEAGQPLYAISQIQDVTERKRAEEQLRHQALHDSLTGLPNRALFQDRVDQALLALERRPGVLAVLFLDLDNFKLVNDTLGHPVGDELLLAVAQRLSELTRPTDTVARLSGDEFGILCEQLGGAGEAVQIAERLTEVLALPLRIEERELVATASVGIVIAAAGATTESLLRDADVAMYRAKSAGPGRYEIFDPAMHKRALERLDMEHALRTAIERDEFRLVYQPIVALDSGVPIACEALLRWQRPELGTVSPDDFIPIAEETGMIVPIGRWVLARACIEATRWREILGPNAPTVNVNLSPRQLADADLVHHVTEALAESGLEHRALCLEITESAMIGGFERATEALGLLRGLGVTAAIDDFGSGVSSLGRLKELPLEVLKIDKAFVDGLVRGKEDRAIIAAVKALAEALDLTSVAEGVETAEQADELRRLGCHAAQGFYFSRPLEPAALAEFLRNATAPSPRIA
jgi:diguanylate cyclase (GGDEF)-like protein/PAS domain S-box-containing protein